MKHFSQAARKSKREEKRAVFLDRDGTVSYDPGYLNDPSKLRLFPLASKAIRQLNRHGFKVILVTNQSGIGRGLFTEQTLDTIHAKLREKLARSQATLDKIYFCPHRPETACRCRKPKTKLLRQAQKDFGLSLKDSFMIGDSWRDLVCGENAGCQPILVLTGEGKKTLKSLKKGELSLRRNPTPPIAANLLKAVKLILYS